MKNKYILVVGTERELPTTLLNELAGNGYRVARADSGRDGLDAIYRTSPDIILLARRLPDIDGLLLCGELKNDLALRHLPVILVDSEPLLEDEVAARESGADDYVSQPLNVQELDVRIWQLLNQGTVGLNCHPVTGLPGYDTVYRKVQQTLEKDRPFAVCLLDIHGFRYFNQRYGYSRGDELLRTLARRVVEVLEEDNRYMDFFGHLGADDFVLVTDPDRAGEICSRIVDRFEQSIRGMYDSPEPARDSLRVRTRKGTECPHKEVFLSIAVITHEAGRIGHFARLVEQGSELLSWAKKQGRSLWVKERRGPFTPLGPVPEGGQARGGRSCSGPPWGKALSEHFQRFREIVQAQSLQLHFQPIVELDSGEIFGYEALVRGPLNTYFESPVILFSLARKLEMELVLDLLCLRKLQRVVGKIPRTKKIFFNVSPSSFSNPMFREFCWRAAGDLPPERMVLEVTRKRRIREYPRFRESVEYFKEKGYPLAVDDARAGTVSLRTILELEPDYIKTDVTVTRHIQDDPSKQRILRQFRAFCSRRGVILIPEGVESEEEKDYLRRNGVRLAQGFLFSRPAPLPA